MRHRLALFALLCGSVAGETLTDRAPLTVVLEGQPLPDAVLSAMRSETQATVAASRVQLIWRIEERPKGELVGQVAIVHMLGHCDAETPIRSAEFRSEPLGQTHIVNGEVLPFTDIRCDAVRRLVARDLRGVSLRQREELLGRAIGRVLAHELYHIMLHTTDHGHRGLSRAEQSSAALLAPSSSFAQSDEHRLADAAATELGAGGR
jgi:hypothetical protein